MELNDCLAKRHALFLQRKADGSQLVPGSEGYNKIMEQLQQMLEAKQPQVRKGSPAQGR